MEEVELQEGKIVRVKGEDIRKVGLPDWHLYFIPVGNDPGGFREALSRAGAKIDHQSDYRIYFSQPAEEAPDAATRGRRQPRMP